MIPECDSAHIEYLQIMVGEKAISEGGLIAEIDP